MMPRNRMPFSNSDEGYGWMANWCDRCLVDAPFRNGISPIGCPLILTAMCNETPDEWLDGPRDEHGRYSIADQYHCINFRAPGGGGGEPKPKPTPRGQLTLLDREPLEGRRMFVQPEQIAVSVSPDLFEQVSDNGTVRQGVAPSPDLTARTLDESEVRLRET